MLTLFNFQIQVETPTLFSVAFVLMGVSGFYLIKVRQTIVKWLSAVVGLIGIYGVFLSNTIKLASTSEQVINVNHITGFPIVSPLISIVFTLFSLAMFFSFYTKQKFFWMGVFGSLIFSLGSMCLIDAAFDIKSIYLLVQVTRMDISTALMIVASGLALCLYSHKKSMLSGSMWMHWAMAIFGLVSTLYTSQAIRSYDQMQLTNLGVIQTFSNDLLVLVFGISSTIALTVFVRLNVQEKSLQKMIFYDLVPVVIVYISLLLSVTVYVFLHSNFKTSTHQRFHSDFKTQITRLKLGLQKYSDVLFVMKDIFDVSKIVDRDEFKLVSQRNIDRLPGLQGLGWIQKLSPDNQKSFEEEATKELNEPYFLFHRSPTSPIKHKFKSSSICYPIVYIEPADINHEFLGLEMSNFDYFKRVVSGKNDSRSIFTSGQFNYYRNGLNEQGVFSLLEVDKASKELNGVSSRITQNGYVFSIFDVEQAVQSILFSFHMEFGINLLFENSIENRSNDQSMFLYRSSEIQMSHTWGGFTVTVDDTLKKSTHIEFADRKWQVSGQPVNSKMYPSWAPSNLFLPVIIFILGCFVAAISRKRNRDIRSLKSLQEDLRIAMIEAQQSDQSKSDFLANMSHEIRTPMNAIIGMSHLALQTRLSPKQRNFISKVHQSGESLLDIINDILDFSKIEAGKLSIEETGFSLEKVLQNFNNLVGLKSEEKKLELILDIPKAFPMNLLGDPLRLGQILINLGSNAVKFTSEGDIVLNVSVMEQSFDKITLLFKLTDSGIGMSESQIEGLFQAFSQADASTTRRFGGTGLGLAISKRLCELMNGKIWVDSIEGQGSSFCFTAQFGIDHDATIDEISLSTELKEARILIVEPNLNLAKSINISLSSKGLDVYCVNSATEAEDELLLNSDSSTAYDLMLIDSEITDNNVIQFIKSVNQNEKISTVRSVILTTIYSKSDLFKEAHSLNYDIDVTIDKPLTPNSLLSDLNCFFSKDVNETTKITQSPNLDEDLNMKLKGLKILLAEDNKINQILAVTLLKQAGIDITVAGNGKIALEKLEEQNYDGVLMDIQMPEMDGYTATKIIRENEKYKDLPIVAMTANIMSSDIEKIEAAGMNAYIGKPLDIKGMYRTIAKHIKHRDKAEVS